MTVASALDKATLCQSHSGIPPFYMGFAAKSTVLNVVKESHAAQKET